MRYKLLLCLIFQLTLSLYFNFNENEKASKWLEENAQKEGWAKSEKLKNRATTQGTLVFHADKIKRLATIIEVLI
jgi:translation elongation factor EF-Ts